MLRTLWGPDCTEDAAAFVAAEVIASLAKKPLIAEHLEVLLSSVVAAIRRGRHTKPSPVEVQEWNRRKTEARAPSKRSDSAIRGFLHADMKGADDYHQLVLTA